MTRIAFLGTGLLGSAMVEAAVKRGDTVAVWNRTAEKARALEPLGVRVASTPADAARGAAHVHLVLSDDAAVDEIVGALRPDLSPEAVILDHTTTQPALTAARAGRLAAEGVRYLHCPVFMGPTAARQRQGTVLAAGPRQLFDEVEGELSRMAARVHYAGERSDLAAALKLCGNAFIIGIVGLVADVVAIARGADIPPGEALQVFEMLNPGAMIGGRGRNMIAGDFTPSFELTMARKDVRLMQETAGDRPLAALAGIAARMDTLLEEGHGDRDFSVIGRDARG